MLQKLARAHIHPKRSQNPENIYFTVIKLMFQQEQAGNGPSQRHAKARNVRMRSVIFSKKNMRILSKIWYNDFQKFGRTAPKKLVKELFGTISTACQDCRHYCHLRWQNFQLYGGRIMKKNLTDIFLYKNTLSTCFCTRKE